MNFILLKILCFFLIFSSVSVIISKNALHSLLFLASTFFFSAATIFLLEDEFLALFFLIIYLGAIMILFLFVVMMLDLKHNLLKLKKTHLPTGAFIGLLLFSSIAPYVFTILNTEFLVTEFNVNLYTNWYSMLDQTTDITVFAEVFYHYYAFQILIAGLLLYVATIGVVFLTSSKYKRGTLKKKQSLTRQLSRRNVL